MYAWKLGEKSPFPQIFDTLCNIWLRGQSACNRGLYSWSHDCHSSPMTNLTQSPASQHCVRTHLAINKTDVFFTILLSIILFRNSLWIRLPFTHGPNISLMYCDLLGAFPTLTFIHSQHFTFFSGYLGISTRTQDVVGAQHPPVMSGRKKQMQCTLTICNKKILVLQNALVTITSHNTKVTWDIEHLIY